MDVRVWMEQVEAALVPGNEAILSALVRLAPQPTPPGAGLVLARALIATGQHDRALELVPAKPSTQDSRAWAAAASDLALAGRRPNDPALSRTLLDLAAQADPPDAFDIVEQHVRLCLARGARQVALRGLDHLAATMDRRSPRHPPLSGRRRRAADQAIAELRAEILASTAPPAVDPQERRLDELAGDSSPAALTAPAIDSSVPSTLRCLAVVPHSTHNAGESADVPCSISFLAIAARWYTPISSTIVPSRAAAASAA